MLNSITLSSAVTGVGSGVGAGGDVVAAALAGAPVGAVDALGVVTEQAAAANSAAVSKVRDGDRIEAPSRSAWSR
jgi:hypothetical protein